MSLCCSTPPFVRVSSVTFPSAHHVKHLCLQCACRLVVRYAVTPDNQKHWRDVTWYCTSSPLWYFQDHIWVFKANFFHEVRIAEETTWISTRGHWPWKVICTRCEKKPATMMDRIAHWEMDCWTKGVGFDPHLNHKKVLNLDDYAYLHVR
jgi:hypothetical protein